MTHSDNGATPRQDAIEKFRALTGCAPFKRVIQHGREPDAAEFYMQLDDDRVVRLGGARTLYTQAEFGQTMMVTTGVVPRYMKTHDWRNAIAALFWLATDVEDPPEESRQAQAEDIIATYLPSTPNVDRDNACTGRLPWTDEAGTVHIHPRHLQQYLGRELGERHSLKEVRALLRDAGYEPRRVNYQRDGQAGDAVRTTTIYYVHQSASPPVPGVPGGSHR
jgi:hypothetical protein